MDPITLIGILSGAGLLLGAILLKTSISTFVDVPSLMIVLGGTFASTCISFSGRSFLRAIKDMVTTLFKHKIIYPATINELSKMAEIARRESKLGLEKIKTQSKFLQRGIDLLVSDVQPENILRTLNIEKNTQRDQELESQTILEKMGDLSPAWGMVGTLIGLVIMMLKLDDPSKIGPAMAIALLTTFYGAVFANLLFIPCATKIEQRSSKSLLHHELMIEGIISIANEEHPRMIKEKLMGFLTSDQAQADKKK